jgi:hypothetical protein
LFDAWVNRFVIDHPLETVSFNVPRRCAAGLPAGLVGLTAKSRQGGRRYTGGPVSTQPIRMSSPDALLFVSSLCPHCAAVLAGMSDLVKRGVVGRLEVVNSEQHPEEAAGQGVRSVPWLRIGPFALTGVRTAGELETWAGRVSSPEGFAEAFHDLLNTGDLAQVLALVADEPFRLAALLAIVGNPEASINVRLGAGVVFEEYAGTPALQALIPALGALSAHADARVRADACHTLGLCRDSAARLWLEARLADADADVREIAADGLAGI